MIENSTILLATIWRTKTIKNALISAIYILSLGLKFAQKEQIDSLGEIYKNHFVMNKDLTKEQIIERFGLQDHPEGGYYKETYRSELQLNGLDAFSGSRSCSTGIYFLITAQAKSHLHKIKSDEMWHFYAGDSLTIHMLTDAGEYSKVLLGSQIDQGEVFQFTVPAGVWFAASVNSGGDYSLVGCTVAPGFDFADFEVAEKDKMKARFDQHHDFLESFCLK